MRLTVVRLEDTMDGDIHRCYGGIHRWMNRMDIRMRDIRSQHICHVYLVNRGRRLH